MKAAVIGATILGAVLLCGCNQKAVAENPSGIWTLDYDAALKQAAAENKPVLVNISGTAWCSWCRTLEKEVFSTPEFVAYAKDNLICVLLDYDRSGRATQTGFAKQHEPLLEKFQVEGFPTVLIMNPQGRMIQRTGYRPGGPLAYIEMIKEVIAGK